MNNLPLSSWEQNAAKTNPDFSRHDNNASSPLSCLLIAGNTLNFLDILYVIVYLEAILCFISLLDHLYEQYLPFTSLTDQL